MATRDLGSLEILDSIFEFADLENLTISAKKFSISCAEVKSVQFWLIFTYIVGNYKGPKRVTMATEFKQTSTKIALISVLCKKSRNFNCE